MDHCKDPERSCEYLNSSRLFVTYELHTLYYHQYCRQAMGMIVRRPRWLQGLYRRHFFALEAIFLALLAVTSISSCPRKCQCIWRDSKITVDCSDQELAAIPTTVEANTQVSNNIYAMSLLTTWTVNNVLGDKY